MSGYMVLIILGGLSLCHGISLYISNSGEDKSYCGTSLKDACKSLQYAFDTHNKSVDHVILDGGDKAAMTYYVNKIISLSNNITFVSNSNRFIPTILQHDPFNKSTYAFAVNSSTSKIFVNFTSIKFVNINIILCQNITCTLSIEDCTIKTVKNWQNPLINFKSATTENSTLDIKSCIFTGLSYVVSSSVSISISISNTIISGGRMWCESRYVKLIMNNATFRNCTRFWQVLHIKTKVHPRIHIVDSKFYNIIDALVISVECSSGKECRDTSTAVIIQNTAIHNCTNKHDLSVLKFQNINLEFKHSVIKNNNLEKGFIRLFETHANMTGINITGNQLNFFVRAYGGKLNISFWKATSNSGGFGWLLELRNANFALINSVKFTMNNIGFLFARESIVTSSNNFALDNSGAFIVYFHLSTGNLINNKFINNRFYHVFNLEFSNVTMGSNEINNSISSLIVRVLESTIRIRNTSFTENICKNGVLYFTNSNTALNGVLMDRNQASSDLFIENDDTGTHTYSIINIKIIPNEKIIRRVIHRSIYFNLKKGTLNLLNMTVLLKAHTYMELQLPKGNNILKLVNFVKTACTPGSKLTLINKYPNFNGNLQFHCIPCETGTYSLHGGAVNGKDISNYTVGIDIEKVFGYCMKCPNGGICNNGNTRSRGHFYGFQQRNFDKENVSIKYIICPEEYCCSNKQECSSYATCSNHRIGTLCGECQSGYKQDFFSNKCIKNETCKNPGKWIWVVFSPSVMVVVIAMLYLDTIPMLLKKGFHILRKKLKCENKRNGVKQDVSFETEESNTQNIRIDVLRVPAIYQESAVTANKPYTLSGILGILVSYFQVKSLLETVNFYNSFDLLVLLSKILNLDVLFQFSSSLCTSSNLDMVKKKFTKDFLFYLLLPIMLSVIALAYFYIKKSMSYFVNCPREQNKDQQSNYQFTHRLGITYVRILLLIYKSLTFFTLTMIHCVYINETKVLYIQGNLECYQSWQYGLMVFLVGWIIPFPITLWQSYKLYIKNKINFTEFLLSLTVPIILLWYLTRSNWCLSFRRVHHPLQQSLLEEVLTGSYRCGKDGNQPIFWEHWRLTQRLLLSIVSVFFINPLEKCFYTMPLMLVFIFVYFNVRPFKPHLKLLHWCEATSLLSFCFVILLSNFNAFLLIFDISITNFDSTFKHLFTVMDYIISPVFVLCIYFIFGTPFKLVLKTCKI